MSQAGPEAHGSPQGEPSADDTGSAAGGEQLAVRLSELARSFEVQDDPDRTLQSIVRGAVELVPGAQEGSISVVRGRKVVQCHAPSGGLARRIDELQGETGQGPCLDAVFEQRTVHVPDLRDEQRWPEFVARAVDAGALSMLAFQLFVEGDNLGALNLYSRQADAFDDESEHVGLLLAAHAAVAFACVQKVAGLARAVETRQLIGQAQGMLMERFGVDADAAFALLVRVSQDANVKLRDIAEQLVTTGGLPQLPR